MDLVERTQKLEKQKDILIGITDNRNSGNALGRR